eukprot:Sspe_Gene.77358::Locus_48325_Transcript_1_1_Confidence_1.000_Length_1658::g.77358::m.77358
MVLPSVVPWRLMPRLFFRLLFHLLLLPLPQPHVPGLVIVELVQEVLSLQTLPSSLHLPLPILPIRLLGFLCLLFHHSEERLDLVHPPLLLLEKLLSELTFLPPFFDELQPAVLFLFLSFRRRRGLLLAAPAVLVQGLLQLFHFGIVLRPPLLPTFLCFLASFLLCMTEVAALSLRILKGPTAAVRRCVAAPPPLPLYGFPPLLPLSPFLCDATVLSYRGYHHIRTSRVLRLALPALRLPFLFASSPLPLRPLPFPASIAPSLARIAIGDVFRYTFTPSRIFLSSLFLPPNGHFALSFLCSCLAPSSSPSLVPSSSPSLAPSSS